MPITRIVSGAQTGADRGGLDAAIHCGLPHGGFCPKGRRAEDGTIPDRYALTETTSKDYLVRTEANVVDSDATVIFTHGDLDGGSLKTAEFARKHGRPWMHINMAAQDRRQAVDAIAAWLRRDCPTACVMNVAGSRESKAPGIEAAVKAWMVDVISKVNGTLFYPIGDAPTADDGSGSDALPTIPAIPAGSDEQAAEDAPLHHPKTIGEAAQIVLDGLDPEFKGAVAANTDREGFRIDQHFGLGLRVRNSMVHWNRNIIDLYADFQKGRREGRWSGEADADSVGGVIVGLVWDALHGGG